jgi:hypothetical protein
MRVAKADAEVKSEAAAEWEREHTIEVTRE